MPAVAVVGAVVAIGVAAEVGTTLAIIAAVGATISAVGALTNNKGLMIAGGVIGAVGAIGGLASAAGLIGDLGTFGASTASETAGVATDAGTFASTGAPTLGSITDTASGAVDASAPIDEQIANWSTYGSNTGLLQGAPVGAVTDTGSFSGTPGGDIINTASGGVETPGSATSATTVASASDANPLQDVAQSTSAPAVNPTAASDTPVSAPSIQPTDNTGLATTDSTSDTGMASSSGSASAFNDSTGTPVGQAGTTNPADAVAPGTTGTTPPGGGNVTGTISNDSLINAGQGANASNVTVAPANNSVMGGIWKFIQNNQTLAAGVLKAGSAFLSGATDSLKPAQVAALNAQAQSNIASSNLANQQAAMIQQQITNMQGPVPTARNSGTMGPTTQSNPPAVTGAPQGIINQTPPPVAPPQVRV